MNRAWRTACQWEAIGHQHNGYVKAEGDEDGHTPPLLSPLPKYNSLRRRMMTEREDISAFTVRSRARTGIGKERRGRIRMQKEKKKRLKSAVRIGREIAVRKKKKRGSRDAVRKREWVRERQCSRSWTALT